MSALIMSCYCKCEVVLCSYWIKGFSSLLVNFAVIFCHLLTFLGFVEVYVTFGLLDCFLYNEDFVLSRFCSIQFTVTLAGLKNFVRYTEDLVIKRFVKSRFHCIFLFLSRRHFLCLFTLGYPRVLVKICMQIVTHS